MPTPKFSNTVRLLIIIQILIWSSQVDLKGSVCGPHSLEISRVRFYILELIRILKKAPHYDASERLFLYVTVFLCWNKYTREKLSQSETTFKLFSCWNNVTNDWHRWKNNSNMLSFHDYLTSQCLKLYQLSFFSKLVFKILVFSSFISITWVSYMSSF